MKNKFRSIFILIILFSLPTFAQADDSDFLNLCKASLKGQKNSTQTCTRLNSIFFKGKQKQLWASVSPQQIGAPAHKIDKKIRYIAFRDPNYMAGVAYCYFSFRKWIDMEKFSPDDLGLLSSGFAILDEKIDEYQKWLTKSPVGKQCAQKVKTVSQINVLNLRDFLQSSSAIIALNPFASVRIQGGNFQKIIQEQVKTINHERTHVFQVLCPSFEKASQINWSQLSQKEKNSYKKLYPNYNWNDLKVAGREYIAFEYEDSPKQLFKFMTTIKDCKF